MTILELFFLAIGLSMDAFAVAISLGLGKSRNPIGSVSRPVGFRRYKNALLAGAYFGAFQGLMPLAGFFAATHFAEHVKAYSHWIAFVLLLFLGGKMIYSGFKKEEINASFVMRAMLLLALATSIDAMAAGASLAFLEVSILPAVLLIGIVTFVVSAVGVRVGALFGEKFKGGAAFAGGIILILLGVRIVFSH